MNSQPTSSKKASSSFSMDDFAKALEQEDMQFQKGQVVRGKVFNYESNGAYIDIGGKSLAFLPIQEVSLRPIIDLSENLPLNEEKEFLIIKEQDAEGQITLSIRQLQIKDAWDKVLDMQSSSQSVQAYVTGVNKGGVTVEVEGLRGFIPRSQLIERENLQSLIGQTLTTSFIQVSPEEKKLVLSQRQATRSVAISQLEVGQLIEGKVTGIKPFGVFIDIDGTTGLLHIKQISQSFVESLSNVFQVGQLIKALVVNIDEGQGRVSLSTRLLEDYPGEMLEKRDEVMETAKPRAERARKKLLQSV